MSYINFTEILHGLHTANYTPTEQISHQHTVTYYIRR